MSFQVSDSDHVGVCMNGYTNDLACHMSEFGLTQKTFTLFENDEC